MSDKIINFDEYIDLTDSSLDLESFTIKSKNFTCDIIGPNGEIFKGFLLARSKTEQAFTFADVDFQWSATDQKFPPRITFRRTNSKLEDKPINKGSRYQRIPFEDGIDGYREFWKMIGFLSKFKELVDLGETFEAYQMVSKDSVVKGLLAKEEQERIDEIIKYVRESKITLPEMASALTHRTRSDDLDEFKKLLINENNYTAKYRAKFDTEIKGTGNEAVWHHFLSNHKWIFGLSLDLRFMEDFVDEAAVGNPDTTNKGNPKSDMLGWSDYTVQVEIKTPEAEFFTPIKNSTGRTNTWSFTSDFIDGMSQVLAQNDDWQSNHLSKTVVREVDGEEEVIDTGLIRTIDPKIIFIYGNKSLEIPETSKSPDTRTKRDTLERFSRNNRNVDIVSFDELYKRAFHIVHGVLPQELYF